jgi:hypothetical protein
MLENGSLSVKQKVKVVALFCGNGKRYINTGMFTCIFQYIVGSFKTYNM